MNFKKPKKKHKKRKKNSFDDDSLDWIALFGLFLPFCYTQL